MAKCLYCNKRTKRDNMGMPEVFCAQKCARDYKKVFPGMAPTEPYSERKKLLRTVLAARYGNKAAQTKAYRLGFRRLWNDKKGVEVILQPPAGHRDDVSLKT